MHPSDWLRVLDRRALGDSPKELGHGAVGGRSSIGNVVKTAETAQADMAVTRRRQQLRDFGAQC